MFVKSSWFIVLFKFSLSLLTFRLIVLSLTECEVLKPATIIIELSVSPLDSVNVCFIYFGSLLLEVYIFVIVMSS